MAKRKETTTFGLRSEKVARLLRIGAEGNEPKTRPDALELKAELLRDRLAETLSLYDVESAELSKRQTRMSQAIADLAGEPIGRLLLNPKTDLSILRRIKDHGRKLSEAARSVPERHVTNTVYYAAIASAIVHCDTRITAHAFNGLTISFSMLGQEQWIPKAFARLFSKAARICQDRCIS